MKSKFAALGAWLAIVAASTAIASQDPKTGGTVRPSPGSGAPPAGSQAPAGTQPIGTAQPPAPAEPPTMTPELKSKASYLIGQNFGMTIKVQGVDIDPDQLIQGFRDALGGAESKVPEAEANRVMADFQACFEAEMESKFRAQAAKNIEQGRDFLAANAAKPGVQTTASGLQIQTVQAGTGASPTPEDTVKVNYRGMLIDGTEFDSSYKRNEPMEFPLGRVIPGWIEGLQLMKVGGKARLVIPSDLAYGETGSGDAIGPNAVLIFDIELLNVTKPQAPGSP